MNKIRLWFYGGVCACVCVGVCLYVCTFIFEKQSVVQLTELAVELVNTISRGVCATRTTVHYWANFKTVSVVLMLQ